MHLPGMNFVGPEWSKPIDRVDNTAYHHDLAYKYFDDTAKKNLADEIMIEEMDAIKNPTIRERIERGIIKPIISSKAKFGLGLSEPYELAISKKEDDKEVKWSDKLANELHRPVVKHFRKRKVIVNGIDEVWAASLIDMKSFSKFNDCIKYLLMVIDVFSKYGWIVPLKIKTGVDVANALNKIFGNSKKFHRSEGKKLTDFSVDPKDLKERKCQKMWVDKGLEFYNVHVKAFGVELYSTENEEKSCVVERWNRTMKDKMFKYFSANSTRKNIDVLDEMVNKYNNTKHSSIKMTPVEARDKKNEKIFWLNLNGNVRSESVRPKFSIGDKVRITKKKGTFEKGYTPRWTEEVFTVSQVQFTDPPTYKITENNSEEIQGTFYEQEMQKTDQNIFRIEKVIRKLKNKSLVKWYGYPDSFNS
ncbi:uncharacterized protein LOC136087113 [Hydra vulgaris]|uniref:Uncharacterized protein LOC136087113 n=1 Tax=Hydra vulgaris TaxID=6087 RepID=A0ABM4CUU4_HYDVU